MPPHSNASDKHDQILTLLGPPMLLPEEADERYLELAREIIRDLAPQGMVEQLKVRDIIDLAWDILRWRRISNKFLASWRHLGVDQLLEARGIPDAERESLRQGWARGNRRSIGRVKAILRKAGLSEAAISAQTFIAELTTFERMDVLIRGAEIRRNSALEDFFRCSGERERRQERKAAARQKFLADQAEALSRP